MKQANLGVAIALAAILSLGAVNSLKLATAQPENDPPPTMAALLTHVAEHSTRVAVEGTPTIQDCEPSDTPETEAATLLAGDATPQLPAGDDGVVDVVAVGSPVFSTVPFALRNNTGEDVFIQSVFGNARNVTGAVVESREASTFAPTLLPAGGFAVGYVNFGIFELAAGLTFEFETRTLPVQCARSSRKDLEILETSRELQGIAGVARNQTDQLLRGPFIVVGVCLDRAGLIRGYYSAYAIKNVLSPGETTQFYATFYGTGPCDAFLLGAFGYDGI